jgi:hypothetical protein
MFTDLAAFAFTAALSVPAVFADSPSTTVFATIVFPSVFTVQLGVALPAA